MRVQLVQSEAVRIKPAQVKQRLNFVHWYPQKESCQGQILSVGRVGEDGPVSEVCKPKGAQTEWRPVT